MRRFAVVATATAAIAAACNASNENEGANLSGDNAATVGHIDVGFRDAGITILPTFDPGGGFHLDEGGTGGDVALRPKLLPGGERRVLLLTLRSTPTGAAASVDGIAVGPTPTFWENEFDGREHEFTFVLPGYAMARLRFVPTTTGHVHPTLVKVSASPTDGGVPEASGSAHRQPATESPLGRIEDTWPPPTQPIPPPSPPQQPAAPPPGDAAPEPLVPPVPPQ